MWRESVCGYLHEFMHTMCVQETVGDRRGHQIVTGTGTMGLCLWLLSHLFSPLFELPFPMRHLCWSPALCFRSRHEAWVSTEQRATEGAWSSSNDRLEVRTLQLCVRTKQGFMASLVLTCWKEMSGDQDYRDERVNTVVHSSWRPGFSCCVGYDVVGTPVFISPSAWLES